MTLADKKRRKAREKRKKLKSRRKRRYSDLIIALPILVFAGILVIIYGPFGGGEPAPDFTLTDVQGRGTFTLSAHRGKVVVIEFFSTNCDACSKYHPTLQQIRTLYSQEKLTMISISVSWAQDTESLLRAYADANGIRWYVTIDTGTVTADYNIGSTPTTVIVDKDGNIVFKRSGNLSSTVLGSEIDSLL